MYDASGVKSVTLHYRLDKDGVNPIEDTVNEVYRSGIGVECGVGSGQVGGMGGGGGELMNSHSL